MLNIDSKFKYVRSVHYLCFGVDSMSFVYNDGDDDDGGNANNPKQTFRDTLYLMNERFL